MGHCFAANLFTHGPAKLQALGIVLIDEIDLLDRESLGPSGFFG